MAINKTTKTIIIVGSLLIIAGVGAYLLMNRRKPKKQTDNEEKDVLSDVFENLNFEFGKSDIKRDSYPYLDKLAETLVKAKTWKLDIEGHTDDVGSDDYNMKLSQNRADAVKKYLTSKGVSENMITAKGFGETKPIVPNDSDKNREINRRVEFKITKPNNEVITTIV
jgi:outer membrane protein OmpA-like peptidoglycan-associated protein